jgi:hypothetical protein
VEGQGRFGQTPGTGAEEATVVKRILDLAARAPVYVLLVAAALLVIATANQRQFTPMTTTAATAPVAR